MAIRWQLYSTTRFGVPVRVDIEDSQYSGGIIPICGSGDPVTYTVGQPGGDPFEKILPSSITLRIIGQEGDFADLFERDLSRFRIHMYIDGDLESTFIPMQDTFSEPATAGTHVITVNGANLSVYRNRMVPESISSEVHTRLNAIRLLINSLFDFPIVDGSVFYTQGSNMSQSALNQVWIKGERIEEMDVYAALEALIPRGHQIRIARGRAIIVPVTEPTFTGYEYDSGGSFAGSITFDGNLQGFYTGGALGRIRSKLQTFDGVKRVYEPGEIDNIVPSGDIEFDDFIPYPQGGTNGMIPAGWSRVSGLPVSSRRVQVPNGFGWRVGFTPRAQANENPDFQAETEFPITTGERMRHSFTMQYTRERSDSATVVSVWVQIRVGSYYLVRLGTSVHDPDFNTYVWRTASNLPNPGLTQPTKINFALQAGGFQTFEFTSEPVPAQGNIEYTFNFRPAATSGILSDQNSITFSSVVGEVVDADGQLIRQIETETGDEDGELYEYTEQYGDGPVVIAPGALSPVNDFTVPVPGWVYKNEPAQPLDELEAKYIYDQVTKGADLITGTVDAFDSIDLVDGMRVNYLQVSMRGGSASIEVYEIQDHDLEAVPRRFREEVTGNPNPGSGWNWNRWIERLLSIGILAEDIDREERTAILCELDNPIRRGLTYWVINSDEMSEQDRWAGIYPFVPILVDEQGNPVEDEEDDTVVRYGPGLISIPIESAFFSAPEGSMIVKAPGQDETEAGETEEDIDDIEIDVEKIDQRVADGEANLAILDDKLEELEEELDWLNDEALPELYDALDELNDVTLPNLQNDLDSLEDDLDELNNVTLPNLQDELDDILPITEAKISDNAISAPKLQANSVIAGKIATDAVTANTIAANAITYNKIRAGAVVAGKLAADSVAANNIQTDAVTANKIRAGAVVAGKLAADSVAANNIQTDAVTANKILAGAITTGKIGANAVTANKIDVDDLVGSTAWIGALTAGIIDTGDLYSRNATIRGHLTVGTSSVAGQISVVGAGTIVVDSNGRIRLNSNGSLEVGNNGNVRINSGGTISIGSGSTFTMGTGAQMNIGNRIFIGQNLSSFEADNRVFIGNWSNSESAGNIRPIVQVRQNDDNYVLLFARPYGSGDPFFTVRANGQDALIAGPSGVSITGTLTMGNNGRITNSGGDYRIDRYGFGAFSATSYDPNTRRGFNFYETDRSTLLGSIWASQGSSERAILIDTGMGSGNRVTISSTNVQLQASNAISIIVGQANFQIIGLPTTNPGGSNRVWKDGTTLRIT